jgi:hypothetical protein
LKHQFPHVFQWRAAVGNHLVVVLFEIEIFAEFLLFRCTEVEMLGGADEISGEVG